MKLERVMQMKCAKLRSNLISVTVLFAYLRHRSKIMASILAPSAIAARTKLHEIELKVHDVTRLKAIWEAVKPKKRIPLLPSNWKRRDLEGLKQLCHDTVVPDLELPDDYHYTFWGKAKLTMEIAAWEEMAKETGHGLDHSDLFEEALQCVSCALPMVARKNRLTLEEFWGCMRYPHCQTTLPWVYGSRPVAQVQRELEMKQEDNWKTKTAEKPDKKPPNHVKEQDKKQVIPSENPDQLFRPKGRTRKADRHGEPGNAVSSDGSWIPIGKMEAQEVSSGDEAKFSMNLTKEEMEEIEPTKGQGCRKEVKLGPSETGESHGEFSNVDGSEHEDGPVPLSASEVQDRVARGQARRAHLKKGMIRRFLRWL